MSAGLLRAVPLTRPSRDRRRSILGCSPVLCAELRPVLTPALPSAAYSTLGSTLAGVIGQLSAPGPGPEPEPEPEPVDRRRRGL